MFLETGLTLVLVNVKGIRPFYTRLNFPLGATFPFVERSIGNIILRGEFRLVENSPKG